ncbi:class I SAM-dependent methyltransferase [Aerolutibacter ruishenii]|uniref:16S rRNA (Guanine1207-N2)-methyltransferase n=1 Tax=Aerolutibacter ruishenii TaxID=686800 RepID=A0A562LRJ2_9GAMM|nr:class I SAM-dependent methyltransferase [Lysobacter ruishenii]TWI10264.1 16S rRNA (guanine1207-N2)-methyltransferase [Lysobacter ruishenii]
MAADADPALETLFLPFVEGRLAWPEGGVLFLRARDGWPLHRQPTHGLVCEQTFKPDADALQRSGLTVCNDGALADAADGELPAQGKRYPLVLLLPPRQRDESRALMARALDQCAPGGRVLACVANNEGAKSAEDDLRRVAGAVSTLTKNKCRVFWTTPRSAPPQADAETLIAQWRGLDRIRPVADGRLHSRPGVFAWDRVDPASALLVEHLPADLAGRAADLGAGIGYLGLELLARCPRITALDLYEAEARALELARRNLQPCGDRVALGFHWHDVTSGLPAAYDVIISNPPFHAQGRAERPDIGRRFIAAAARALRPGGRLWLVANRHLPYEAVLHEHFGAVRDVATRGGFKVVEAVRGR